VRGEFNYQCLEPFFALLKVKSPRHWLVLDKTVLSNVKDKNVAKKLKVSRQRIVSMRKQALLQMESFLISANFQAYKPESD